MKNKHEAAQAGAQKASQKGKFGAVKFAFLENLPP